MARDRPNIDPTNIAPGQNVPGMSEVGFPLSDKFHAVHSITEEVAKAIMEAGGNPTDYNKITWPIGASRWASGKFILHSYLMDLVMEQASAVYEFRFGDIAFDNVTVRNVQPLLLSDGAGVVYSVEIVDARFWWSQHGCTAIGYNVSLTDKSKHYDQTEMEDPANPGEFIPWTTKAALEDLFTQVPVNSPDEIFIPDDLEMLETLQPMDLKIKHMTVPAVIDKILSAAGYVLIAFPNLSYASGAGELHYQAVKIGVGEETASETLEVFGDSLVGGGLLSPSPEFQPPTGTGLIAVPDVNWIANEVPTSVEVAFPTAPEGGTGHRLDVENSSGSGLHYVTDAYRVYSSAWGRTTPGNGSSKNVFDTTWAIIDAAGGVVNEAELTDRADSIANRYYDRYRAGVCDILFVGILKAVSFAGGQEIIWSLPGGAPHTRIRGSLDDVLLGFSLNQRLTPNDVTAIGGARVIPRPDGGILIDSIAVGTTDVYYGKITEVQPDGGGFNATYSAVAYSNAGVAVSLQIPIRDHDIAHIDMLPAIIDDGCFLGVKEDGSIDLYALTELPTYINCEGAGDSLAQRSDDARLLLAHGL